MAHSDIYLINPSINSGSAVYLRGVNLTYGFKPLTRTTPLNNTFALSETQITGFENPRISIKGVIDTNNLSSSTIQHTSLLSFAKNEYDGTESTTTRLYVTTGNNDSPLYATDVSTSSIKVIVESFNLNLDTQDSDLAHLWSYDLTLVETR